ncbi:hypothetical protein SAMN05444972_11725 [Marininema halotolerans]|uniref:Uncharacterized protein n=1 Tax=Marininema halotolerans TaxID=1155944 RepID=A0A1I6UJX5_9BACL|nr:hypothetical protein SAMN05444972_11725 [Marininema halotolerans]
MGFLKMNKVVTLLLAIGLTMGFLSHSNTVTEHSNINKTNIEKTFPKGT